VKDFIDISFDNDFKNKEVYPVLPWLPWVGNEYSTTSVKTLIMGESTYNWADNDKERKHVEQSLKTDIHLRKIHHTNAIEFKGTHSRYARNLEQAIFQRKQGNKFDAHSLWTKVAYHNLVLIPMETLKQRPTIRNYKKGWSVFLTLIASLEIDQCLVIGLNRTKIKSLVKQLGDSGIGYEYQELKPSVSGLNPKYIVIKFKNKQIKLLFIKHSSSYFSWSKWGDVINRELDFSYIKNN
jgi:hypothetical protein